MAQRRRRANGEGTIYRRADGRYVGQLTMGRKADGQLYRRTVYGRTRGEVVQKLQALHAARAAGSLGRPTRQTLEEYLWSWLHVHRHFAGQDGKGLRPNTVRNYQNLIRRHIGPAIGAIPLAELAPQHLENLYTRMVESGLSVRMAEMAHRLLHVALEAAVDKDLLRRNPCDRISRPPTTRYRAEDRPRLSWQDVPRVLEAVRGTIYFVPLLIAMSTGLRRGEVTGLRWQNVDLERGVIRVREQLQQDEETHEVRLAPVKTPASRRDVPLPPDVVEVLRQHRAAQGNPGPTAFVCTSKRGTFLNPRQLNGAWSRVRRRLQLPAGLRLHDMRGSFATWLAERGVDVKVTSRLLGHADVRVTLGIYQSVTGEMERKAALALEGICRDPGPGASRFEPTSARPA